MNDTDLNLGNVVALKSKDVEMGHPTITLVTRYWDSLRAGRLVPQREEIDPREIQNALSYSFILDRTRPGSVRFRLSGMHLNDVLGMEARGMPVRALCDVPYRQRFMEKVEQVFEKPALLEADLRADKGRAGAMRARLVLLPLSTHGAKGVEVNRALGIFVTDGPAIDPPTRFATRGFAITPLERGVSAFDSRRDLQPAGMAEDMSEFLLPAQAPERQVGKPKLRVLQGGKS
ncbi:MAG: PAS domain-containing protein [Pseudomonadota bacterium]